VTLTVQMLGLAGWFVVAFVAAGIGAAASVGAAEFYEQLSRPGWAPPARLFGPVWSVLYALMAVSAWLVWRKIGLVFSAPLVLFVVQLAVNALWSWLFFRWQLGALAFAEVVLLWCLIVATMVAFYRVSPVASALLLPYLGWVTLATALAWSTWQRNPGML